MLTNNIKNEYVFWAIGITLTSKPNDRYFSGSKPIKRYSTEGNRIAPQLAM